MVAILADYIFKCIFLSEDGKMPIQISLKLVLMSPTDNKPASVQVMAWCKTRNKPLPEPMLTQFTDAYMQHSGEMRKYLMLSTIIAIIQQHSNIIMKIHKSIYT